MKRLIDIILLITFACVITIFPIYATDQISAMDLDSSNVNGGFTVMGTPNAPANLTLKLQSSRSAYLAWSPSTSQGVIGYKIYRNGVEVGDTPQTVFAVTGLSPNTGYTFTVKAYNSSYDLSPDSNSVAVTTDSATSNGFIVIVANPLYQTGQITTALNTYRFDLAGEGWTVKQIRINSVSDATANWICPNPQALKDLLIDFYNAGYQGFVLIGSAPAIPTAYWRVSVEDYRQMPTDMFYGDLDPWTDLNGDGVYEAGTPGNEASLISVPELFYGRISAGGFTGSLMEEAGKVASYLNKVHNYRMGGSGLTPEELSRGLLFSDDDWAGKDYYYDGRNYGYVDYCTKPAISDMHVIYDKVTTNRVKLESELSNGYLFADLVIHGGTDGAQVNQWKDGTKVWDNGYTLNRLSALAPNAPKVLYINSYSCNSCQFADSNGPIPNLGASYIFNSDYTLNVTGVAASCSMPLDRDFFTDFANGIIGLAHKNYVARNIIYQTSDKGATPAYMLLGDPALRYRITQLSNTAPQISNNLSFLEAAVGSQFTLPLTIFDPENDPVTVTVNGLPAGASFDSGVNTITWTPTADQVSNSYPISVTVEDNYGHSYTEDFTVYVSHFRNGLLNSTTGWTALEGTVGSPVWSWSPLKDPVSEFATANSRTAISQSIPVQSNTDYTLVFWCKNNLTLGTARLRVNELGQEAVCPTSDGYNCYALRFNSGSRTSLTVSLHAGYGAEVSSGKAYFTGLRLFPSHYNNFGFEGTHHGFPDDWYGETRNPYGSILTSESNPANVRSGNYAARIDGSVMNASIFHNKSIIVKPNTNYRFTGYIKTNNVVAENPYGSGAYFFLSYNSGAWATSSGVLGTNDWQLRTIDFNSGNSSFVSIECHLGGWPGWGEPATGTAWFDDLSLVELP